MSILTFYTQMKKGMEKLATTFFVFINNVKSSGKYDVVETNAIWKSYIQMRTQGISQYSIVFGVRVIQQDLTKLCQTMTFHNIFYWYQQGCNLKKVHLISLSIVQFPGKKSEMLYTLSKLLYAWERASLSYVWLDL